MYESSASLESFEIFWFYSFEFEGKIKNDKTSHNDTADSIWNKALGSTYFKKDRLEKLFGDPVTQKIPKRNAVTKEKFSSMSTTQANDISPSNNISLKDFGGEILFFPFWNTGLIILSISGVGGFNVDHVILTEKLLGHHYINSSEANLVLEDGQTFPCYVVSNLIVTLKKLGISGKIGGVDLNSAFEQYANNLFGDMYSFAFVKGNNLSEKEKLSIFTRGDKYFNIPADEIKRELSRSIRVGGDGEIFFGRYSGGMISKSLSSLRNKRYKYRVLVLLLMRALTNSISNKVIAFNSRPTSVRKAEKLLHRIAILNLILSKNTISNSYKFNDELMPSFYDGTNLNEARDNIEKFMVIVQHILDRKRGRITESLLIYLSILATIIPIIFYFFNGKI